jgi:hypothetical protein
MEAPLATISFCQGDPKVVAEQLRKRVADIVYRNPWLGGWLIKKPGDKSIKLYFDETSDDITPDIFRLLETGEIPLAFQNFDQEHLTYDAIVTAAKTKPNDELVGKNESLFKVVVIPDSDDPDNRYALVVSMSHVGGDAHTFYHVYNMLCRGAPIVTMNPMRKLLVNEAIVQWMGQEETFYIKNVVATPFFGRSSSNNKDDPLQATRISISSKWLQERLEQEVKSESEEVEISQVSPFSIVVSWFFQLTNCTVGLAANDHRNKLPNFDLNDLDAGNYVNAIPLLPPDYASSDLVEQAFRTGKRCGSDPPTQLPKYTWDSTYAIAVNWARYYDPEIEPADDHVLNETFHMPLYNTQVLTQLSNTLSFLCMHTASSIRQRW